MFNVIYLKCSMWYIWNAQYDISEMLNVIYLKCSIWYIWNAQCDISEMLNMIYLKCFVSEMFYVIPDICILCEMLYDDIISMFYVIYNLKCSTYVIYLKCSTCMGYGDIWYVLCDILEMLCVIYLICLLWYLFNALSKKLYECSTCDIHVSEKLYLIYL